MKLLFSVSPSSGVPIYRQVVEQIERMIVAGHLQPGELLPSVRSVAAELDVNPMTISKAYSILEAKDMINRLRGRGMAVSDKSSQKGLEERTRMLSELVKQLVDQANQLGLSQKDLMALVKKELNEDA